jgi:hypothetical protein
MSERGAEQQSSTSNLAWAGGAVLAAVVVVALLFAVIGRPDAASTTGGTASTTTTVAPTTTEPAEPVIPTGRVAYLTADGRVLSGDGAEAPIEVASGAALGPTGLGAVAVAPTGDLIAFVRSDGALVTVPARGGETLVLATDAVTTDIGAATSIAWDPTGATISYLAVGTLDMVAPRPESPPPLSATNGVFRDELPDGELGNVVKVVDRTGEPRSRIGDPSLRSMTGIASSRSDDFLLLESINPVTRVPYTLSVASSVATDVTPTVLSADDPAFSPDGNFIVAVGPDKSGQELLRVATDSFGRTTLVSADEICSPAVSPDSTRIVYGTGPDCSKLMLVSSSGGTPVDITPPALPGTATYRYGELSWTAEGHYVVFADCRSTDGPVSCGGPVTFLDPDQRLVVPGTDATTVATLARPLLGDLTLAIIMAGPIQYEGTFAVDAEVEAELTELGETTTRVDVVLTEDDQLLELHLQIEQGNQFATGQMRLVDPTQGIDRTFLVLGTASAIGVRVVSLSGLWVTTDDLPFVTGEFRLAVRRG